MLMKRLRLSAIILITCYALFGCGNNIEWFPSQNGQNTTTQTSPAVSGKYVATNQEKNTDPSFVYHYPDHGMKIILAEHWIWFQSAAEALVTGRRPCATCNPPVTD